MPPTDEGFGEEEKFITLRLDFDSYQKSPVWTDEFTVSYFKILVFKQIHVIGDFTTCMTKITAIQGNTFGKKKRNNNKQIKDVSFYCKNCYSYCLN